MIVRYGLDGLLPIAHVRMATRLMQLVLGLGLTINLFALTACTSSDQPTSGPPPDLSMVLAHLTSADPALQELALRPEMRAQHDETPGVLPVGSLLVTLPETWAVDGIDGVGSPSSGTVRARLTRPAEAATEVELHVVRIGNEWFLDETSPA